MICYLHLQISLQVFVSFLRVIIEKHSSFVVRYCTKMCGNAQNWGGGVERRVFVMGKFGGCVAFVLSLLPEKKKVKENGREEEGKGAGH